MNGQLMPYGDDMDFMAGVNSAERDIGMSVCVFCSLSGGGSGLLWPAAPKYTRHAKSKNNCNTSSWSNNILHLPITYKKIFPTVLSRSKWPFFYDD
jgi:hypothetical protein